MIKLTILDGSRAGFSVLIEAYGLRILFDTSIKKRVVKTAKKANLNISHLDYIVLSHGHWDHTEGLKSLDYAHIKNVLAHPACFEKKWDYEGKYPCGCEVPLETLQQKTNVILSKEPKWLVPGKIVFLGEIPRENNFESQKPEDSTELNEEDFVLDDSALVIKNNDEGIVISGCSHSGICNIITYAEKVTGVHVNTVLGGFHLFDKDIADKTVEFFTQKKITNIYPAHCINEYAFSGFEKIGGKQIKVLQELEF